VDPVQPLAGRCDGRERTEKSLLVGPERRTTDTVRHLLLASFRPPSVSLRGSRRPAAAASSARHEMAVDVRHASSGMGIAGDVGRKRHHLRDLLHHLLLLFGQRDSGASQKRSTDFVDGLAWPFVLSAEESQKERPAIFRHSASQSVTASFGQENACGSDDLSSIGARVTPNYPDPRR
jgi:hypothetical protein